MPALSGVNDLQSRKRELLLESELNRKVLQVELNQWHLTAARWQSRFSVVRLSSLVALPALRLFLSRRRESRSTSWLGRLWRSFFGRPG